MSSSPVARRAYIEVNSFISNIAPSKGYRSVLHNTWPVDLVALSDGTTRRHIRMDISLVPERTAYRSNYPFSGIDSKLHLLSRRQLEHGLEDVCPRIIEAMSESRGSASRPSHWNEIRWTGRGLSLACSECPTWTRNTGTDGGDTTMGSLVAKVDILFD
jgi:hypothetical protein